MTLGLILLSIMLVIWIAMLQPVWLKLRFSGANFSIHLRYLGFKFEPSSEKSEPESPEKPEQKKQKSRSFRPWLNVLSELIHALRLSARYLFKRILIRELSIRGTFGFEDPSATGTAYGIYSAIRADWPLPDVCEIDVQPDFENERSALTGSFEGGLRPSSVISAGFVFLRHLPKRKIIKAMRS